MRVISTDSLQGLPCKRGEVPDHRKVKKIVAAIDANRALPGLNVRNRVLPWGTIRSYDARNGSFTPTIWRAKINKASNGYSLTLGLGLVNGIEPTIAGTPISGDAEGVSPKLLFSAGDFDANGVAQLVLAVTLNTDWTLQGVSPAVYPFGNVPTIPWTAVKLLGFLVKRGGAVQWQQMCFFNVGLGTLFNRGTNGHARWVWWGE